METDQQRREAIQRDALAWLARVSLSRTAADIAAMRRWRDQSPAHAAALAQAGRLWRELAAPVEALAREGATSADSPAADRPSRRALLGGGIALAAGLAGIALVRPPLQMWPSLAELSADRRTGIGEQQHLALEDAVSVDLNTRTSIALHAADQGAGFDLISGEAAITVARQVGKPFHVVAADGRVMTSRAVFNVRRDGASVRLTCIEGDVAVECGRRNLTLRAAEQVAYDADGLGGVVSVDPGAVAAWRDGALLFRNTPLAEVIDEVNRYRTGRIMLIDSRLGRRLVTARFEIKHLDTVLVQIADVFKAPVKRLPGGLVLVG
ncbi:transmembrane sensor [Rhodoblastus sphagnicola]|nr:FecR domain-containing protein [Rhodoblastus sphagnicola]MBB4196407.1 transmembrane sensor [Rhodoblastus sphagnicola]